MGCIESAAERMGGGMGSNDESLGKVIEPKSDYIWPAYHSSSF